MQQTKNETKQEQPLEFTKIQGFDVLDKLPEETKLKSYNEEFFNTLNNLKFLSCSIPDDDKLFYLMINYFIILNKMKMHH